MMGNWWKMNTTVQSKDGIFEQYLEVNFFFSHAKQNFRLPLREKGHSELSRLWDLAQ